MLPLPNGLVDHPAHTAQECKGTVETSLQTVGAEATHLKEVQHQHTVARMGREKPEPSSAYLAWREWAAPGACSSAGAFEGVFNSRRRGCLKAKIGPVDTVYTRQDQRVLGKCSLSPGFSI